VGEREVAYITYTHLSKCKNDKIKLRTYFKREVLTGGGRRVIEGDYDHSTLYAYVEISHEIPLYN
jgi:hypothetical protein